MAPETVVIFMLAIGLIVVGLIATRFFNRSNMGIEISHLIKTMGLIGLGGILFVIGLLLFVLDLLF